jgi:hypothetical protein
LLHRRIEFASVYRSNNLSFSTVLLKLLFFPDFAYFQRRRFGIPFKIND